MMLCNEVKDKLYEYIYGELEEEDKLKIDEHLLNCSECQKEYTGLKQLLIDDMESVTDFASSITMPAEIQKNIRKKLDGSHRSYISRYAAAACILIFMFYAVPVAAYYVIENTALNKYIDFDKGLVKEIEEGKLQVVNKSSTMKDITFRVDGIIKKMDKTTILFTVKVPEGKSINYAMPSNAFNVITIRDQFGNKYESRGSAMSLKSSNEDGEVTAIMDFEPLKFWSYKLTINITAMETGKMTVTKAKENDPRADEKGFIYDMNEGKTVYGSWKVDFYIDRSIKK